MLIEIRFFDGRKKEDVALVCTDDYSEAIRMWKRTFTRMKTRPDGSLLHGQYPPEEDIISMRTVPDVILRDGEWVRLAAQEGRAE